MSADPRRGSEPGRALTIAKNIVADKRVEHVSVFFPIWQGNEEYVRDYLSEYKDKVSLNPVRYISDHPIFHSFPLKYLTYAAYNRRVSNLSRRLAEKTDLYHQINYTGFRFAMPVLSSRSVTVWGPISATEQFPLKRAWAYLDWTGRLYYTFYICVNWAQLYVASEARRALKHANLVIAATRVDYECLARLANKVAYIPETTVDAGPRPLRSKSGSGPRRIVWSGALINRKGFPLLLEAVRRLHFEKIGAVEIHVYGIGPKMSSWKRRAEKLEATFGQYVKFEWMGEVPRKQFLEELPNADVLVATTFREANSNVIAEAIAARVPVVALAISGLKDTLIGPPNEVVSLEESDLPKAFANGIEAALARTDLTPDESVRVLRSDFFQGVSIVDLYQDAINHESARTISS